MQEHQNRKSGQKSRDKRGGLQRIVSREKEETKSEIGRAVRLPACGIPLGGSIENGASMRKKEGDGLVRYRGDWRMEEVSSCMQT